MDPNDFDQRPLLVQPAGRAAGEVFALLASWVVPEPNRVLGPGAGVIVARGQIVECIEGATALRRRAQILGALVQDLGGGILTAGLVNAHSHLELAALRGKVSSAGGFAAWIGRVLQERAAHSPEELAQGALGGLARMARTGTTALGDIDSLGVCPSLLRGAGLRVVQYREVLDAGDAQRTGPAIAGVELPLVSSPRFTEGLSPHAPFTVSSDLMGATGRIALRRQLPVTIHWSETLAEVDWLAGRASPLEAMLGPGPGQAGLDHIESGGLLGPCTSLVHGNHPQVGEADRIAASGATLVHCPGSHRFFGRGPFPLDAYLQAGVSVALGTDSAASNEDLDMLREARILSAAFPGLRPSEIWSMLTEHGARALGLEGRIGRLRDGHAADLALFSGNLAHKDQVLDALLGEGTMCLQAWVAGDSSGPWSAGSGSGVEFDR